jgi:hypothetical protein
LEGVGVHMHRSPTGQKGRQQAGGRPGKPRDEDALAALLDARWAGATLREAAADSEFAEILALIDRAARSTTVPAWRPDQKRETSLPAALNPTKKRKSLDNHDKPVPIKAVVG